MRLRIATKVDWGWDLPPGCRDDDPRAPWNAKDRPENCVVCGEETDGEEFCSDECRRKDKENQEY